MCWFWERKTILQLRSCKQIVEPRKYCLMWLFFFGAYFSSILHLTYLGILCLYSLQTVIILICAGTFGEWIATKWNTLDKVKGIWFWNLTRSINNMSVRKPILNSKKFQLTLFKYGLAFAPKRFIRSVARNKPTAVIKSIFSIGINATINRSRNPIVNFFTELKWSFS